MLAAKPLLFILIYFLRMTIKNVKMINKYFQDKYGRRRKSRVEIEKN